METLKHLSGKQKFIFGLVIGLIVGWGGTYFVLNQASWNSAKCAPGETAEDCIERLQAGVPDKDSGTSTNYDFSKVGSGSETTVDLGDVSEVSGTNTVSADDQPAGSKVVVNMVTFAETGWLVIHEDTNGVPGKILGARRYEKGIYLGEVDLLRATGAGKVYYAMLHKDNGDKQFDSKVDTALLDSSGKPVMDMFKAQ